MVTSIPEFPRHLSKQEQAAMLQFHARAMAKDVLAERGLDASKVDLDTVIAAGAESLKLSWAIERIETLEAQVADLLRQTADDEGAD